MKDSDYDGYDGIEEPNNRHFTTVISNLVHEPDSQSCDSGTVIFILVLTNPQQLDGTD